MRFNVPPGWPMPPAGWTPPADWRPDPAWPDAPPGWQWWVEDAPQPQAWVPPWGSSPQQSAASPWGPSPQQPAASPWGPPLQEQPSAQYAYWTTPPQQATAPPPRVAAEFNATMPDPSSGSRLDEQLAKLGRRRRERGERDDTPIVTDSGSDAAAKWIGVAASVAKFGPVAAALPGTDHVLEMVKALYDIEDEQSRVLHSIDSNVKLLKEGPFRAGRLLLNEAHRIGERDGEARRLLESAKDRFYDAQPLASSVQERALVEMHLGLVWLALGRSEDARHWLERSYQSARAVIDELAKQAGNVKVLKSKWATTAVSIYYPVGLFVLPLKLKRVWNADRARSALSEFLTFANTVAACLNNLNTRPVVPTMALVRAAGGEQVLQEHGMDGQ